MVSSEFSGLTGRPNLESRVSSPTQRSWSTERTTDRQTHWKSGNWKKEGPKGGHRNTRGTVKEMEVEIDEKELKAAGAEPLTDGRRGLRIHGWEIETLKCSILNSSNLQLWAKFRLKSFQIWDFVAKFMFCRYLTAQRWYCQVTCQVSSWKYECFFSNSLPCY